VVWIIVASVLPPDMSGLDQLILIILFAFNPFSMIPSIVSMTSIDCADPHFVRGVAFCVNYNVLKRGWGGQYLLVFSAAFANGKFT